MALFTRKDGRAGDAAITTLATPPDAAGAGGYTLQSSDLTSLSGLFSTTYDQKLTMIHAGRSRQGSKLLKSKQVVFTFSCGDSSGVEQQIIKAFFTYDRPIAYVDMQRGVAETELYVTSIDDAFFSGADSIQVTATMIDSDIMSSVSKTLIEEDLAASTAFTSIAVQYTNDNAVEATVLIELGAGKVADWTGTTFSVKSESSDVQSAGLVAASVGKIKSSGIRFDSLDEFVYGSGTITNTSNAQFFSVQPGATATITVTATPTVAAKLKVTAATIAPRGQYDLKVEG